MSKFDHTLGYIDQFVETIGDTAISTNTTTEQTTSIDLQGVKEGVFAIRLTGYTGDRVATPTLKYSDQSNMTGETEAEIYYKNSLYGSEAGAGKAQAAQDLIDNGVVFIPVLSTGSIERYVTLDLITTGTTGGGTYRVDFISLPLNTR